MSKSIEALNRISTMMGSKEGINKIMKDLEELEIHTKCRMVKSKDRKTQCRMVRKNDK